jgi:hypothetical protein
MNKSLEGIIFYLDTKLMFSTLPISMRWRNKILNVVVEDFLYIQFIDI